MRAPLVAVLLLLPAALAGCFSDEETAAPIEPALNESASQDAANLTIDDGTVPMDEDIGHMPHIHDYWQGRERVTLMDEDLTTTERDTFGFTFMNLFGQKAAVGGKLFELPEGATVFEGTGQLDVTVSWSDPTVTGVSLRYQSPAQREFSEAIPLVSGTATTIEVAPEMTDMPHEKTSRWTFMLAPADSGQAMYGKIHVTVDIVRMRDVTKFPGHPELFGDANTLTLYSGPGRSSQQNFVLGIATFVTGGASDTDGVASEKVVPMETQTITANLTITSATANLGRVEDIQFLYRAADAWRFEEANLVSGDVETGIYQFAFPVTMEQTDSPYSETSQWRFDVRVGTQTTGVGGPCDRCADAEVEYTVDIVAYDSLLDIAGELPEPDDDGR